MGWSVGFFDLPEAHVAPRGGSSEPKGPPRQWSPDLFGALGEARGTFKGAKGIPRGAEGDPLDPQREPKELQRDPLGPDLVETSTLHFHLFYSIK